MKNTDRQKLLAECRMLLKEMARSNNDLVKEKDLSTAPIEANDKPIK